MNRPLSLLKPEKDFSTSSERAAKHRSGAQQARFRGGYGDSRDFGDLFDRAVVYLLNFDDGAECWPQPMNGTLQMVFSFRSRIVLFRVDPTIGHLPMLPRLALDPSIHRDLGMSALPAQNHQRRVDGNSRKPGGKGGSAIKVLQVNIGLQKSILKRIFRVLPVSRDPIHCAEDFL